MTSSNSRNKDVLIKEYEIINSKTQFLENLVWKTFSIIGIISISLLLSDKIIKENLEIEIIQLLGMFSIALTIIWWKIAERWWDVQGTLYIRSRSIERKLGMASNLYIGCRDGACGLESGYQNTDSSEVKYSYDFGKKGVQKYFSFILLVTPLAWLFKLFIDQSFLCTIINHICEYIYEITISSIMFYILVLESFYSIAIFIRKQITTNQTINLYMLRSIQDDASLKKKVRYIIDNKKLLKVFFIKRLVKKSQKKNINDDIINLINGNKGN